jgi:hypothetical protein
MGLTLTGVQYMSSEIPRTTIITTRLEEMNLPHLQYVEQTILIAKETMSGNNIVTNRDYAVGVATCHMCGTNTPVRIPLFSICQPSNMLTNTCVAHSKTSLIKIEGVDDPKAAKYVLGSMRRLLADESNVLKKLLPGKAHCIRL